MSSISPYIPLVLGIIAGSLFLIIFIIAWVITMRNRRLIRKYSGYKKEDSDKTK